MAFMTKTDRNAILHIGAGKCGSSALQSALCANPVLNSANQSYEYCVIQENGRLLRGQHLTTKAARTPFRYLTSPLLHIDGTLSTTPFETAARKLNSTIKKGRIPILSNEGWLYQADAFAESKVLENMGLNAEVIVFLRPQVPWINSAWWQWGAWSDAPFERWIANATRLAQWENWLKKWEEVPGVASIKVQVARDDVIDCFCNLLSVTSFPRNSVEGNEGLPAELLRFFQRNREFRKGPHDSEIDFRLRRLLSPRDRSQPWILPHPLVEELLQSFHPGTTALLSRLDQSTRQRVADDPDWWHPSAYSDRKVEPYGVVNQSHNADSLIRDLVEFALANG